MAAFGRSPPSPTRPRSSASSTTSASIAALRRTVGAQKRAAPLAARTPASCRRSGGCGRPPQTRAHRHRRRGAREGRAMSAATHRGATTAPRLRVLSLALRTPLLHDRAVLEVGSGQVDVTSWIEGYVNWAAFRGLSAALKRRLAGRMAFGPPNRRSCRPESGAARGVPQCSLAALPVSLAAECASLCHPP